MFIKFNIKLLKTLSRFSDELRAGRTGFDSRQDKIFLFSSASRPDMGSLILLSNRYLRLFLRGYGGRGVKRDLVTLLVFGDYKL
jgi:hypothetical protein